MYKFCLVQLNGNPFLQMGLTHFKNAQSKNPALEMLYPVQMVARQEHNKVVQQLAPIRTDIQLIFDRIVIFPCWKATYGNVVGEVSDYRSSSTWNLKDASTDIVNLFNEYSRAVGEINDRISLASSGITIPEEKKIVI